MKLESYNKGLERRAREAGRAIDNEWIKENEANDMIYGNRVKTASEMEEEIAKLKVGLDINDEDDELIDLDVEMEKVNFEGEKKQSAVSKMKELLNEKYKDNSDADNILRGEAARRALEEAMRKVKDDIKKYNDGIDNKKSTISKLESIKSTRYGYHDVPEVDNKSRGEEARSALEDAMNKKSSNNKLDRIRKERQELEDSKKLLEEAMRKVKDDIESNSRGR